MRNEKKANDERLKDEFKSAKESEKAIESKSSKTSMMEFSNREIVNEESRSFNIKSFIKDNPQLHVGHGTLSSEIKKSEVQNGGNCNELQ